MAKVYLNQCLGVRPAALLGYLDVSRILVNCLETMEDKVEETTEALNVTNRGLRLSSLWKKILQNVELKKMHKMFLKAA